MQIVDLIACGTSAAAPEAVEGDEDASDIEDERIRADDMLCAVGLYNKVCLPLPLSFVFLFYRTLRQSSFCFPL